MKYIDRLKQDPKWPTYLIAGGLALFVMISALHSSLVREPQRSPAPAPGAPRPAPPPVVYHGPVAEPTISLKVIANGKVLWLKVEDYLPGVCAAEMDPKWPEEALKAQAIVARTFLMQKIEAGVRSKYGTVASTDTTEFQAYNPSRVNQSVKAAVLATRGQVLTHNGKFAYAYFHSCSGGKTATAYEGLNFTEAPVPYLRPVEDGPCSNKSIESWTLSVPAGQFTGIAGQPSWADIRISSYGPSGRALTFRIGNRDISAVQVRRALGPNQMKSTLITGLERRAGRVIISGKGWGHGVGLSQWGAHDRALSGAKAAQILSLYYPGTVLEKIW